MDNLTTPERIKSVAKQRGISVRRMLIDLEMGPNTIQHMKTSTPKTSTIQAIAEYLGVSVDYLLCNDKPIVSNVSEVPSDNVYQRPVFDSVSAGFGAYADSHIIGYMPVVITNPYDVEDTICITVEGDSMAPKIEDGDIIIVRKDAQVDDGKIGVVRIGDEAVVKKVTQGRGFITLTSLNSTYEPRTITGPDLDDVEIVGLVVGTYKQF